MLSALLDCGSSRGVGAPSGAEKQAVLSNVSGTWDNIGMYQLGAEKNLYPSDNGSYGLETVSIGSEGTERIPGQTVAGVATPAFWSGSLGLGHQRSQSSVLSDSTLSLLSTMKSMKLTPSLSFGYTAGASYSTRTACLLYYSYLITLLRDFSWQFNHRRIR